MSLKRAGVACTVLALTAAYFWPSGEKSPATQTNRREPRAVSQAVPALIITPQQTKRRSQDRKQAKLLAQRIKSDNYCDPEWETLSRTSPADNSRRKLVIFDALHLAADEPRPDPCARALFAGDREEVLTLTARSEEPSCRLIRGLLLTDQWEHGGRGRPNTATEKQEGLKILSALADSNANNGFYSFFELGATDESNEAARERAYGHMLSAERFDNPLQSSHIEISRIGQLNSTAFLSGAELLASAAGPSLRPGALAARSFAQKGIYPSEFNAWVDRIGARFQRADRHGFTLPYENLLEDAVLRSIALSGRNVLGQVPKVLEQQEWVAYFRRRAGVDNLDAFVAFSQNCDEMLTQVRAVQPRFQADYERQAALWGR